MFVTLFERFQAREKFGFLVGLDPLAGELAERVPGHFLYVEVVRMRFRYFRMPAHGFEKHAAYFFEGALVSFSESGHNRRLYLAQTIQKQ